MQINPDSVSYTVNYNLKKQPAEPKLEMVKENSARSEANVKVSEIVDFKLKGEDGEEVNKYLDVKTLKEVTESLNSLSKNYFRRYSFDVVEEANNRVAVTISDAISGKEIKQIPSEEFVKLMSKVNEFVGMLIDETV